MAMNRKMPTGGLLLAGLAAFAYYKYSKLTPDQKRDLVGNLKERGKKLYDQFMPANLKNTFATEGTPKTNDKLVGIEDYTG